MKTKTPEVIRIPITLEMPAEFNGVLEELHNECGGGDLARSIQTLAALGAVATMQAGLGRVPVELLALDRESTLKLTAEWRRHLSTE